MKNSLHFLMTALIWAVLPGCDQKEQSANLEIASDKPNLVIIMADDMGYGDPRCYNSESKIPTPNIDQLAAEGMLFTDAHTPSAVCTPSRYGLLTGRYAWRSRLKKEVLWSGYDDPLIFPEQSTLASLLQRHGYATAVVGKWHLGLNFMEKQGNRFVTTKSHHEKGLQGIRNVDFTLPAFGGASKLGFDFSFLSAAGHNMPPHCFIENDYTVGDPTIWREAKTPSVPGISGSEVHEGWMVPGWDDREIGPELTKQAAAFIRNQAGENPFFLYLPTVAPHRPCTPPDFIKGKSEAGDRGDMVAEFDWTVGEIVEALDQAGVAENTILIVTSDNGATRTSDNGQDYGHKSCGDLRGFKGGLHEGGHRVPFVLRWPARVEGGVENSNLLCLTDIFATMANLVGDTIHRPTNEDSFNQLAAILENQSVRPSMVHHDFGGHFAIRQGSWKLITRAKMKPMELYDLSKDPAESQNLIESHPEMVKNMMGLLKKIQKDGEVKITNKI